MMREGKMNVFKDPGPRLKLVELSTRRNVLNAIYTGVESWGEIIKKCKVHVVSC